MPRRPTRPTVPPLGCRRTRSGRRARLLIIVLGVPLAVSGCSMQPLSMSRRLGTSAASPTKTVTAPATATARTTTTSAAAASSAATASSAASAAAEPPLVRGALATGSVVRTLAAGGRTLVVDYWTSQPVATWTSDRNVAINVSAHMAGSDTRHAVLVTRFTAALDVDASSEASVLREDSGRFVMTPPYSYGSTVLMPSQPATARTATISVEFDLLIETVPGSGQYFRQTVLDSVQLTFVPQTSQGTSP
jgi:hypothetical protein